MSNYPVQTPYQSPYRYQQTYMNYQNPVPPIAAFQQMPAFPQDGTIPARLVSGREEAIASNVLPGSMFLFYDRAHGAIFAKYIDPQTGASEFKTFREASEPSQEASAPVPEYVTMESFKAFKSELEGRFEALHAMKPGWGKAGNEDA